MVDINNGINAGKVVTVHERSISYQGWTGSGYTIVDPNTGTGAYLIDGGANGSFLAGVGLGGLAISGLAIAAISAGSIAVGAGAVFLIPLAIVISVILILSVIATMIGIYYLSRGEPFSWRCFFSGMGHGLASIGLIFNGITLSSLQATLFSILGIEATVGASGYGGLPSLKQCMSGD